jgi:glycosyltransferase involved in cell wall biosynthesis
MFPKLSVVVPSFNQVDFLEETLLSIINQNYPNLELIVIDGGSTDGSVEILKKYNNLIHYWVSEKDNGQSHAINKGINRASGDWIAWINSDDCYLEGGFKYIFSNLPYEHYDFIYGTCTTGEYLAEKIHRDYKNNDKRNLFRLLLFFHGTEFIIPSQSVFIRKTILDKVGLLDEKLHYVMDLDWFARIYLHTYRRLYYRKPVCFYRRHAQTKTSNYGGRMKEEAKMIAHRYMPYLSIWERLKLKYIIKADEFYKRDFHNAKRFMDVLRLGFKYPLSCYYSRHFFPMLVRSVFPKRTPLK